MGESLENKLNCYFFNILNTFLLFRSKIVYMLWFTDKEETPDLLMFT